MLPCQDEWEATDQLIPREVLFNFPERNCVSLSPDGSQIAYLSPSEGKAAIWVQRVGCDNARMVYRPAESVQNLFWAPDGARLVFSQDTGGDENYHLYAVDVEGGGTAVDLTPFPGARFEVQDTRAASCGLLVASNLHDRQRFDIYHLDIATGRITLDTKNPGCAIEFATDADGLVRAAISQNIDATYSLLVRDFATSLWNEIATYSADDGCPTLVGFAREGRTLVVITAAGASTERLMEIDLANGSTTVLFSNPDYDVAEVLWSDATGEIIAVCTMEQRLKWTCVDSRFQDDFTALQLHVPGDFSIDQMNVSRDIWMLRVTNDTTGISYCIYDRRKRKALELFNSRPQLAQYQLQPMQPICYTAQDSLVVNGYLTLPRRRSSEPVPAIVMLHGGPWERDTWGYNGEVQWLANRGYAVLQPNFRGSAGYGRAFLNAGNGEWGGAIIDDVIAGAGWLIHNGIVDEKRIAVVGGSFGGYAALMALIRAPKLFRCGISFMAPSNLITLMESIPSYWEAVRSKFVHRVGVSLETLRAQSPLFRANEIEAPVLIAHGRNDARVNFKESDQMVSALEAAGREVTYIVFDNEGHGLAQPESVIAFNMQMEAFLAKHLGGRFEAVDGSLTNRCDGVSVKEFYNG